MPPGRRALPALVAAAFLTISASAAARAAGVGVRAASSAALGTTIIVDSSGFTLYHLITEKKGSIACGGACRRSWVPLLAPGSTKPAAGAGISASRVGTLRRPGGTSQVTYDGYALYLYLGDKQAGQANGQGIGRLWYAMTPTGAVTTTPIHTARPTSAGTTPAATTSTSPAPAVTAPSTPAPSTSAPTTTTANPDGCPAGETIPQGADQGNGNSSGNDDDDDNQGGGDDGDGCI